MEVSGQLHAPGCFAPRRKSVWYLFNRGLKDVRNKISFLPLLGFEPRFPGCPSCSLVPPSTAVVSHMKTPSAGISLYSCHGKGHDKVDICSTELCVVKFNDIHSVRSAFAAVCTHRHVGHTIKLWVTHEAWTLLHVSAIIHYLEGDVNTKGYLTF